MDESQLQRLRMLEQRMRRPSNKIHAINSNDEDFKTIKSTDSKKIFQKVNQISQNYEDSQKYKSIAQEQFNVRLSEQQMKKNRKITDYFSIKKQKMAANSPMKIQSKEQNKKLGMNQIAHEASPTSLENNTNSRGFGDQGLKQENRILKQKLKQKEIILNSYKALIVQSTIKIHNTRRNQTKVRVSNNKVRLGEYLSDKKGRQQWIDGIQIKEIKEKLNNVIKEKELLDKSKKQSKRGKDNQENEEWKLSLASQTYFLSRQQNNLHQNLKKLQQQKDMHIKEYRLLYEQQHSRYGRIQASNNGQWPKIHKYQILGLLGKGGFSQVYKGIDTQQLKEVAVKVHQFHPNWNANAKENYVKHALRQNNVHKLLSHPNIVQHYDTVQIDCNSFCTIFEYCEGPDLSFYLKKYKKVAQKEAKMIIRQVINAIKYLHELPDKVIHYDLKPQNILFHKGRIKITDFGLCKTTKEEKIELTSQGVGTYWYLPPECFVSDQKAMISTKVDIWSIGVIYFEMLFGQKPFGNQMSQMRILNEGIMLKANVVNFPMTQKGLVSNQSKDFIKDCLTFNVQHRIDTKQAFNHRLFDKK